ncbi:MAG: MerR family transcriptional regulator, partial [Oscillospiraceae bacterium]|nr:MerR family transcriptional regulator [Oscillospiraceae bacterium]
MKEFLTIKEFSRLSGIQQTTLRYWDEIGIFSPVKRNPDNNYRYYAPEQIIAVNFITVLSGLNIPLKMIGAISSERTPENVMHLIERQESQLDMEMQRLRECYSIMHTRLELIRYGMRLVAEKNTGTGEGSITLQRRDRRAFILGPPNAFGKDETFIEPFMRFCRQSEEMRVNLSYPVGGYHTDINSYLKTPGQPERFISLDPTGNRYRAEGLYLVGFFRGNYGETGDLPERMDRYIKEHKLKVSGPVYS